MNYIDYINEKLSGMSDSELQNFSEQCNFGVWSALLKGTKGAIKGAGKPRGAIGGFKKAYKQERALDRKVENMWSGASPFKPKSATKFESAPSTIKPLTSKAPTGPKPIEVNKPNSMPIKDIVKDDRIGMNISEEFKNAKPAPSNPLPEATNPANVAKEAEKSVAKTAETATKEAEAVLPPGKFNSAREAVESSKRIQSIDRKIHDAVAKGNTGLAASLRKVREREARKIEIAYHKAYSGKLRNIHEWGRDHKWVSAPIGVAGAAAAGGVATAGAAGAAGLWGANKVADAIFD